MNACIATLELPGGINEARQALCWDFFPPLQHSIRPMDLPYQHSSACTIFPRMCSHYLVLPIFAMRMHYVACAALRHVHDGDVSRWRENHPTADFP